MNAPALAPQQQHLLQLIDAYGRRTVESRRLAARYRPAFADKSSIGSGFSAETRDISYALTIARAEGAYLWDVDGNRYVDILLGLGIDLFGHSPAFVREALAAQLEQGWAIGPQSRLVGEVAELVTELTGMERVAFSNTGTEAVMTAIRVARAATGRAKIAIFTNSYHGHHDAVLMRAPIAEYARKKLVARLRGRKALAPLAALLERGLSSRAVPAFPGVSAAAAREVLVLEYDNPRSLDLLRAHRRELAAVLVEPVQSRCPELQPRAFLHALRELTAAAGIVLIFDEMVTGFRIAAGGAQAYFGVKADLATYSKIAGGGLPLSLIAGSARYLDRIDGGASRHGGDSAPPAPTTFFAGTFSKHPLALAAAHATLRRIRDAGPALYDDLNGRAERLVERLNAQTRRAGLAVEFVRFGSFFAVAASRSRLSPPAQLLLSYHLLLRGVFLRFGDKGGFLCTVHSDADLDHIAGAFDQSLLALREAGLL